MATKKAAGTEDKETGDSPLIDMNNREVKRMIKLAKERGFVTYDALNAVLPPEEFSSEQIEDVMAMLSQMGINVVENDDSEENDEDGTVKAANDDESQNGASTAVAKTTRATGTGDRTDDPVRMYLREMGSVELLSREGEIAIAKRIEAGRETMIAGLCESPLTFQAIIIWRDELNEGKVLLRDIIDLDATFAGPEAKKIEVINWTEFRALIPSEWDPGLSSPFDPIAAKEADEKDIEVAIINGHKKI
ncbi:MAG: RNA polymerase sigma factor RpoD, partial [Alphaproteobacteria bacterium]|nr:RNA polymerase sigma factor RpoD [Alphaproteobacteria bacterium]